MKTKKSQSDIMQGVRDIRTLRPNDMSLSNLSLRAQGTLGRGGRKNVKAGGHQENKAVYSK